MLRTSSKTEKEALHIWFEKLILQSNMITFCEKNVEVALCSFILVNSRWAVTNFYHTFPWNFSSFTLITIIQRYHPNDCSNKSRRSAITGPVTVYQLLNKTKNQNTRKHQKTNISICTFRVPILIIIIIIIIFFVIKK